MRIAYNPLGNSPLTEAPNDKDIIFDLVGRNIFAHGIKFSGTDNVFKKHTSDNKEGYNGLVPVPDYNNGLNNRFLREDGTWYNITDNYFTSREGWLNSNIDANNLIKNGVYLNATGNGSNNSNFPSNYGHLITFKHNSSFECGYSQIHFSHNNLVYHRIHWGGNWKDWKELQHKIDLDNKLPYSYLSGVPTSLPASKLENPVTIWGQTFDGTANISGNMSGVGSIIMSNDLTICGTNVDRFLNFYHANDSCIHSWRIGYIGTGSGNDNLLSFESSGSDTIWKSALSIYNETRNAVFAGTVTAPTFIGNLDGYYVNKLTRYTKATAISALAATDTLNTALGKLEYKTDVAYNLVKGAYDGDGTIENLEEILEVLKGISDTETIQAIIGKYLPLTGGTLTGSLIINDSVQMYNSDFDFNSSYLNGYNDDSGDTTWCISANGSAEFKTINGGTPITSLNIGSQSVNYATYLGNSSSNYTKSSLDTALAGKLSTNGGTVKSLSISTIISDHSSPTQQCLVINSASVPEGTNLTLKNAPGIGFHISNRSWASLVFDGSFNFINSDSNGYAPIKASSGTFSGTVIASSFSGNLSGTATKAEALTTVSKGSAIQPIYWDANGKPVACTYTLEKSVPSDAIFTDTHYTTGINAGESGATSNSDKTNPYITIKDNNTYRSQIQLVGSGATTVSSDASGRITISSTDTKNAGTVTSVATGKGLTGGLITSLGTIKCNLNDEASLGTIGTTNRLYAVGVDSNNKLCVNVPWSDTNTDTNNYITGFSWTDGTTSGPTATISRQGLGNLPVSAIPAASVNTSGVVTTVAQTFAGIKTFSDIHIKNTKSTGETDHEICGNNNGLYIRGEGIYLESSDGDNDNYDITLFGNILDLDCNSIAVSGQFTTSIYAPSFYESSDERLKDFCDDLNVSFNDLKKIRKSYFTWKDGDGKVHIGTSAQLLQKLYPELVSEAKDGTLTVDYAKLSIIALAAIDKLDERLKILESKVYGYH